MVGLVAFALAMIGTGFVAGFYAGYVRAVSDHNRAYIANRRANSSTIPTPKIEPKP